jgi:hypothetical protein
MRGVPTEWGYDLTCFSPRFPVTKMKLENWASIAEIVGALAVVVSLVEEATCTQALWNG